MTISRKREKESIFNLKMISEYEKLAKKKQVNLSDGSKINVLFTKSTSNSKIDFNVLLIPGWGSIVLGWEEFLIEAQKFFNLYYIETREKKSSDLSKTAEYTLNRIALDIKEVIEELNLELDKTIILSSSFGAIITAYALVNHKIDPFLTILIGPPYKIDMPPLFRYLVHIIPSIAFRMFIPIGRWWIKKYKSESIDQAAKYLRVIDEADPKKWKKFGTHVTFQKYWNLYSQIENKVIVVDESEDKMHNTKVTKKIAKSIKNSEYVDLKTNKFTHSAQIVDFVKEKIWILEE